MGAEHNTAPRWSARLIAYLGVVALTLTLGGCVGHKMYNPTASAYIQQIEASEPDGVTYDLAIIEFDDHGLFWNIEQLEDTLDLIERRSAEAERGVLVTPYVHGWQSNADPGQVRGDLFSFRQQLAETSVRLASGDSALPDRIIGVYLGWRGATIRLPFFRELTFWDRRAAAERMVSLNMREALFRIMEASRSTPDSKCLVSAHSMGALIVSKTLSPSLTTLLLTNGRGGVSAPADLVVLYNPATDALASWQFINFLKRSNARVELRSDSGEVTEANGPIIVSITSEADRATGLAYPIGRSMESLLMAFRLDHGDDEPSQRYLATHAEGHADYLVSHRAWVEDGEVILERVPGAYNDTPFWVIQVTSDISQNHGDTSNEKLNALLGQLLELNRLYETDVQTWMVTAPVRNRSETAQP